MVSDKTVSTFMERARTVSECLHAYGIHSATLQPEYLGSLPSSPREGGGEWAEAAGGTAATTATASATAASSFRRRRLDPAACQLICGSFCESLMCCKAV